MLFQIKDDLPDYEIKSSSGKPNFQDIKEKKITYPFYFAYKNANKVQKILKSFKKDVIDNNELHSLISELGGIKSTYELAMNYFHLAEKSAHGIKIKTVRDEMLNLLSNSINRDK